MKKEEFSKYLNMTAQQLAQEKKKLLVEMIQEKAKMAAQGQKNSNSTKLLKRNIAKIETAISEKLTQSLEVKNG